MNREQIITAVLTAIAIGILSSGITYQLVKTGDCATWEELAKRGVKNLDTCVGKLEAHKGE